MLHNNITLHAHKVDLDSTVCKSYRNDLCETQAVTLQFGIENLEGLFCKETLSLRPVFKRSKTHFQCNQLVDKASQWPLIELNAEL